jgi:hypothetical protein
MGKSGIRNQELNNLKIWNLESGIDADSQIPD